MSDKKEYEFEVAISFMQEDEELAFQINDLIQDRFKTFIYSEQQRLLAGTDGEKTFNEVFSEKSRIVVILFRENWGNTSWTRIEETAIRNRAHDEGYDFTTFVQLDKNARMPKWLPKNRIYYNFGRWGATGLAPVLEARINEAGGNSTQETIADKSQRLQRQRSSEMKRNAFLSSYDKMDSANEEFALIVDKLKKYKTEIENNDSQFILNLRERLHKLYEFGYMTFFLQFHWTGQFEADGVLTIALYDKKGHHGINYEEIVVKAKHYKIDMDTGGSLGWAEIDNQKFFTSNQLVDKWTTKFLDEIGKRIKKRREL